MIIRRANETDIDALTDLIFRSKASNGYDAAFMEACRDELSVTAEKLEAAVYWVAEENGLAGCVALSMDGTAGVVENFFVDPDRQRQGVGRQLWDLVRARAVEMGAERLVLDADPNAVQFYEAMGFIVVGETPSGSIPGRVLPLMELRL